MPTSISRFSRLGNIPVRHVRPVRRSTASIPHFENAALCLTNHLNAAFFSELERRKVYRVAISSYAVIWLAVDPIDTQVFPFCAPTWVVKLLIVLVALGFPVALVLSWIFDLPRRECGAEDEPLVSATSIPEKSIAVLPFQNLSDDQQNTYLADGIQDDILSNLAKIADLKVISRTSVRQYRGSNAICARSVSHSVSRTFLKALFGGPEIGCESMLS